LDILHRYLEHFIDDSDFSLPSAGKPGKRERREIHIESLPHHPYAVRAGVPGESLHVRKGTFLGTFSERWMIYTSTRMKNTSSS
jgi:hypothetical protein